MSSVGAAMSSWRSCPAPSARAGAKSAKLKAGFDLSVQGWALPPGLGLSVGCAELGHAAGNIEALLEEADARMYADKHRRQAPLGPHHVTETGHATGATA